MTELHQLNNGADSNPLDILFGSASEFAEESISELRSGLTPAPAMETALENSDTLDNVPTMKPKR